MTLLDDFTAALHSLIGKKVFDVIGGNGSRISLSIGVPARRSEPIPNPHLSKRQQEYTGSHELFVECVWRLTSPDEIVAAAFDASIGETVDVPSFAPAVDQPITRIELQEPALDLVLHLGDRHRLALFCDHHNPDHGCNYTLSTPDRLYAVGPRGTLTSGPRVV